MKLLELIFGKRIYYFYSFILKTILKVKGIKIGKNFYCEGFINFRSNKIRSKICIGDDIFIAGNIEIFLRENGQILIENNVKLDTGTRLVVANDAKLSIGNNTKIGKGTVINAGDNIKLGNNLLISGYCYIQSSSHNTKKEKNITDQSHYYKAINIEDDVWLGAHVVILPGVKLSRGSIVGAHSVVNESTNEFEIFAGVPAKKIGQRD